MFLTPPHVVPNSPISDDTDKRLVPYSDSGSYSPKINEKRNVLKLIKRNGFRKRINKEEKKVKHILGERKKKTVGLTLHQKKHIPLNQDAPVKLGSTVL